jgi:hypothetical protein
MKIENNPLKQYFRRPAIYLRLPSNGVGYKPGVINLPETGELPVYPMTAIDEITARTPDALFNGVAVVEIIKSCIPDILDPWSITSQDLDAVLIAIKSAANGNEMEIITGCPACKEESKYDVNLVAVLSTLKGADYGQELTLHDMNFKFRPLTYKEMQEINSTQFEFQRILNTIDDISTGTEEERMARSQEALKNITEITMRTLATTIEYIKTSTVFVDDTNYILDFLRNCDRAIFIAIRDHVAELRASTEIKPLEVRCIHCTHEYKQPFTLNMSDFFG